MEPRSSELPQYALIVRWTFEWFTFGPARSGLSPWWVLRGAAVSRFVFNLPQSRDLEKFKLLKQQRLVYRLALGQPNQEDMVEFLAKGGADLSAILTPLALDLSAFARDEIIAAITGRPSDQPC
jgi:hypothetical protein